MKRKIPLSGNVLAHKIALDPTPDQELYFHKAAGVARFAWNWALRKWNEEYALKREYKCGPSPSAFDLSKKLNAIKDEQFPRLTDVASVTRERAIIHLGDAWSRFFEERKKGNLKYGRPCFKNKSSKKSFVAGNVTKDFVIVGKKIKITSPKRKPLGWIKMREELRFEGTPLSATISLEAGRWFVSINVDVPKVECNLPDNEVGVDLGVKALATLSDGTVFENPKAFSKNLKRLRRLNRAHSRKQNGSNNKRKSALKLAKQHARIANIRANTLHNTTTFISHNYASIGIEDLNVKGMMKNPKLARSIADVGMYEFRRQIAYKANINGSKVVVADRWYPSTKKCSTCGHLNDDLTLEDRDWTCSNCGTFHYRDKNAALNLRPSQIERHIAATQAVTACGEKSSDKRKNPSVKLVSEKQELQHFVFSINVLVNIPRGSLTNGV